MEDACGWRHPRRPGAVHPISIYVPEVRPATGPNARVRALPISVLVFSGPLLGDSDRPRPVSAGRLRPYRPQDASLISEACRTFVVLRAHVGRGFHRRRRVVGLVCLGALQPTRTALKGGSDRRPSRVAAARPPNATERSPHMVASERHRGRHWLWARRNRSRDNRARNLQLAMTVDLLPESA